MEIGFGGFAGLVDRADHGQRLVLPIFVLCDQHRQAKVRMRLERYRKTCSRIVLFVCHSRSLLVQRWITPDAQKIKGNLAIPGPKNPPWPELIGSDSRLRNRAVELGSGHSNVAQVTAPKHRNDQFVVLYCGLREYLLKLMRLGVLAEISCPFGN